MQFVTSIPVDQYPMHWFIFFDESLNFCYASTCIKPQLLPPWQVNFYHDHTKIIICNQSEEYLLTYINEDRISTTFRLTTLLMSGCSLELKHRMEYALNMLLQRCN